MFQVLLMFLDPCSSFQVVRLLTLVVGSFLTLPLVLIRILTRMLYLLWALGTITTRPSRSLIGFTFPLMTPSPVSPPLLIYRLFVASLSWSLMWLSPVILRSMLPYWICLERCLFRQLGLSALQ